MANRAARAANVIRLASARPVAAGANREVISDLEDMLRAARAGELTGLAFCTFLRDGGGVVDLVGAAFDNLVLTRGFICRLGYEVSDLLRERAAESDD